MSSENSENYTVSQKLDNWLGLASFNGFNRLVESKPKIRCGWFVVIVIAYVCMCYHVSMNIRHYFAYPLTSRMWYNSYAVYFPDLTICPVGVPKQYHFYDDKVILGDVLYRQMFDMVKIDRATYHFHYFNKVNYFTEENYTTGHIGSYLMSCTYLEENCDMRNFTLLRDPVFTDCFTFRPMDSFIPRKGHVLTLGLYLNKNLMMYDSDFIAILHERGTLPNIPRNGFRIRKGGTTSLRFRTTDINYLNTPTAPCNVNKTIDYLFTKTSGVFKYDGEACFAEALQKKLFEELNCVDPLVGITKQFENAERCLRLPKNMSNSAVRLVTFLAKVVYDQRYGTETFTKANKLEYIKVKNFGEAEISKAVGWLFKNFNQYKNITQGMLLRYQAIQLYCRVPCKLMKIDSLSTFETFTPEDVDRILEFGLESYDDHRGLLDKYSKSLKNLQNNISDAKMKYLKKLETIKYKNMKYMHQKKYEAKKMEIIKEFSNYMAFLDVHADNVPGDGMVEERSYPAFNLLSDLGGNIGLWVGFSVISIFELLELFVLLLGRVRKKRRLRNAAAAAEGKELEEDEKNDVPLVETSAAV